jgi:hypothetical protein
MSRLRLQADLCGVSLSPTGLAGYLIEGIYASAKAVFIPSWAAEPSRGELATTDSA